MLGTGEDAFGTMKTTGTNDRDQDAAATFVHRWEHRGSWVRATYEMIYSMATTYGVNATVNQLLHGCLQDATVMNPLTHRKAAVDLNMARDNLMALLYYGCSDATITGGDAIPFQYRIPESIMQYIRPKIPPESCPNYNNLNSCSECLKSVVRLKVSGRCGPLAVKKYEIPDDFTGDIPIEFTCPISMELMRVPVGMSDGHTYEEDQILGWWYNATNRGVNVRSPKTNEILHNKGIRNAALSETIIEWVRNEAKGNVVFAQP